MKEITTFLKIFLVIIGEHVIGLPDLGILRDLLLRVEVDAQDVHFVDVLKGYLLLILEVLSLAVFRGGFG